MLTYQEITQFQRQFSNKVRDRVYATHYSSLGELLTFLTNLQPKPNLNSELTDEDLRMLRRHLLTCYCDYLFYTHDRAIQPMTDAVYKYFILGKKLLNADSIDMKDFQFTHFKLAALFKRPTKDFGKKLTIQNFKGAIITDLKAVRLLIKRFKSLENLTLPELTIVNAEDCDLLSYNRRYFIVGNVDIFIMALKQRGSFDTLRLKEKFSLKGHSLAGVRCRSVEDIQYLLRRQGNLEGVKLPTSLKNLDLTNDFIDKSNLQILITHGIPLKNLHRKNLADLCGVQLSDILQIQEAIECEIDLTQITLSDCKVSDEIQVDILTRAKVNLEGVVLNPTTKFPLRLHTILPFEALTPGHYGIFMTRARINKDIALPPLPDQVPKNTRISELTNTQIVLLGNWFSAALTQDNMQDDFKEQLQKNYSYMEPIVNTPFQYELLESLLNQYQEQSKIFSLTPTWIKNLKSLLTTLKSTGERLTAAQRVHAILSEHHRKLPLDKKFQHFEAEPYSLENQLWLILIWVTGRAGYDTANLLPPMFADMNEPGLDIRDIDFNDLYIMQQAHGLTVYRISELLKHLKTSKTLANPKSNREFSEDDIKELLHYRNDLREALTALAKTDRTIAFKYEEYLEPYLAPETEKIKLVRSPVSKKIEVYHAPVKKQLAATFLPRPQFTLTEFYQDNRLTCALEVAARAKMERIITSQIALQNAELGKLSKSPKAVASSERTPKSKSNTATSSTSTARPANAAASSTLFATLDEEDMLSVFSAAASPSVVRPASTAASSTSGVRASSTTTNFTKATLLSNNSEEPSSDDDDTSDTSSATDSSESSAATHSTKTAKSATSTTNGIPLGRIK